MTTRRGQGNGLKWIVSHLDYQGDDCLTWPFARDDKGYGILGCCGKPWKAHRLMCTLKHGNPPPKHVAGHSCGNGHLACVHPDHVEWKTHSENQKDRALHGTKNKGHMGIGRRGRITAEQVKEIQGLRGKMPIVAIAEKYGIKRGTVDYYHRKLKQAA